jgi:hypothetical protein
MPTTSCFKYTNFLLLDRAEVYKKEYVLREGLLSENKLLYNRFNKSKKGMSEEDIKRQVTNVGRELSWLKIGVLVHYQRCDPWIIDTSTYRFTLQCKYMYTTKRKNKWGMGTSVQVMMV